MPGDEHWDPQFGPAGVTDGIYGLAVSGTKVFAGGSFIGAGSAKVNYVAGYDGTNWFALNNGVSGTGNLLIFDVAADANYAYYAGWFTNVDGTGVKYVARWDGTNWSGLGSGVNSFATALKVIGTNVYVGGYFPSAGGVTVNGIARWDGSTWSALGSGVNSGGAVGAIESDGSNVYIAGTFNTAGSVSANNIARWDGSAWSALGPGITGTVRKLLWKDNKLYVGGSFTNIGGVLCTNLAIWDGSVWSSWAQANFSVRDMVSDGTNIFIGGDFTNINGVAFSRIAKWNGSTWFNLGLGLQGFGASALPGVYKMAFDANGRLIVGGNFNAVDGVGASHIAMWNGTNWFAMGKTNKGLTHFIGGVQSLLSIGSTLYIGGIFTEASDLVVNCIARWNGTNWFALGAGLAGSYTSGTATAARAMLASGTNIYVGGNFTNAGGVAAKGMARWDGTNWSALGTGLDATARALAMIGTDLYVGGSFTNAGGVFSPRLAKWNGSSWSTIGAIASPGTCVVNVLLTNGTDLYVGGAFTSAGGVSASCIAKWDGVNWSALGSGTSTNVNALAMDANGILYAGGSFLLAGGGGATRIAKWNGSSWSPLGSGLSASATSTAVSDIVVNGNMVYVAGNFTNAGGIQANGVAKWDGTNWSTLGSGLIGNPGTATGSALKFIGNDLFVGGTFNFAGDKPSMFIARWNDQLNFYPTPVPRLTSSVYTNGQFKFRFAGTSGERYIIQGSTNLSSWTPLLTNSAPLFDYVDTNAVINRARMYRVIVNP